MTPEEFVSKGFDYVIIGGGTAGLTLAARLTEDENITVGVLEAGGNRLGDAIIDTPGLAMQALDKPEYDWAFQTVPQKYASNRVIGWPRGKALGGSSAINFMTLSHPSKQDLDNWTELGNDGWGWSDLAPYFRKSERYHSTPDHIAKALEITSIDPLLRGTHGPIQISFSESGTGWLQEAWSPTFRNAGYPQPKDVRLGSALGAFHQLLTMDPKTATRSYAARAYYEPNANRPNLSVLTDAMVLRIIFDELGRSDGLTATGVEFTVGGMTHIVRPRKEVIVCAGVIQSPQVLELSGIGCSSILQEHNIQVLVDNPVVGENLQDHLLVPVSWEVAEGLPTFEALRDPAVLQQALEAYKLHRAGPLTNGPTAVAFVPYQTLAPSSPSPRSVPSTNGDSTTGSNGSDQSAGRLSILQRQLANPAEAAVQLIAVAGGIDPTQSAHSSGPYVHTVPGSYCTIVVCNTRPFSRGSVHIQSGSIFDPPAIDPAYLSHPADLDVVAHALLHVQKVAMTQPLASKLKDGGRVPMPNHSIPKTLDEARQAVRDRALSEYHPIGTCAMLPREEGGVVGSDLKVYGTKNVRVCDASVFPLHVQGNIVGLVYAFAERAADLIREVPVLKK